MRHIFASSAAAAALAVATSSAAVVITGAPPTLAPVSVNGDVAISYLAYSQTLNAPGTLYLNPMFIAGATAQDPGCDNFGYCNLGTGVISATVGSNPTVTLGASPANNGGGDSYLNMSYQVEYFDPMVATGTPENATVLTSDEIMQTGLSAAEAVMTVSGPNGTVYSAYNCSAASGAAFGCRAGLINTPFVDQNITLLANEPYTVNLGVSIYSHGDVQVSIDPRFTAPAGQGGAFYFSPGVTGGVPEPTTWWLMIVGVGTLGWRARRKPSTLT